MFFFRLIGFGYKVITFYCVVFYQLQIGTSSFKVTEYWPVTDGKYKEIFTKYRYFKFNQPEEG